MNSEVASGMGLELRKIICRFDIYGKINKTFCFWVMIINLIMEHQQKSVHCGIRRETPH